MSDFKKPYRNYEGQEHDSDVMAQVRDLIKYGRSDYAVLSKLRATHKDEDVVNKIYDAYKERLAHITKKAGKFRQIIMDKYAPMNLSYDQLIHKAKKYQRALKLSDDEFTMFLNLSMTDRGTGLNVFSLPNTPLAKTLGYEAAMAIADRLSVKESEMDTVQEILKLYGESKSLHAQVVIQSLSYLDLAGEALVGQYEPNKHNVYSYVHPIVAALFFPRINLIDEHILIANLGYIVKCKYDGRQIMTKPDFELYWDLIGDPNEHVCTTVSPIKDLKNRFYLQTKLWDSVLNLRQGKYYAPSLADFLMAIDACRSNIYDSPDLTYVKDEGSIIRRLLSAFSLRPTMVSTMRLYNSYAYGFGGYGYGAASSMAMAGLTQVTTVPMITFRLPGTLSGAAAGPVQLTTALTQPQWFVENKMIVPKTQEIIHSRDVLFFYVGRRFQTLNLTAMGMPYNFTQLPSTVAGYERMNPTEIQFDWEINALSLQPADGGFKLRSVVCIEQSSTAPNMLLGTSALIANLNGAECWHYHPQGPSALVAGAARPVAMDNISKAAFIEKAQKFGTIFMYQKVAGVAGIPAAPPAGIPAVPPMMAAPAGIAAP